jgi:hypothetical protein
MISVLPLVVSPTAQALHLDMTATPDSLPPTLADKPLCTGAVLATARPASLPLRLADMSPLTELGLAVAAAAADSQPGAPTTSSAAIIPALYLTVLARNPVSIISPISISR